MTQTTGGMSFVQALVFISPDGSTWTEVAGHGSSVASSGGDRAVGEQNTFDSALPIIKGGDRASTDVTVRFVYTEDAAEPFDVARTAHEGTDPEFWVQYRPKTGGNWFKTGSGIIATLLYPQGEAGTGEVVMNEFMVKCAGLTEAAAST